MHNYGFNNFEFKNVAVKGNVAAELVYDKENNRKVNLISTENYTIAVKEDDNVTIQTELLKPELPVKKGTVCGYLHVFCNNTEVKQIELVTQKTIKELTFFEKLKQFIKNNPLKTAAKN